MDTNYAVLFGEKLKEIRKSKNWTAKNFAARIGLNEKTYNSYENGKREPDLKTLVKIANGLFVSMNDLFSFIKPHDFSYVNKLFDRALLPDERRDTDYPDETENTTWIVTTDRISFQVNLFTYEQQQEIMFAALKKAYREEIKTKRGDEINRRKALYGKKYREFYEEQAELIGINFEELVLYIDNLAKDKARRENLQFSPSGLTAHIDDHLLFTYFTGIQPYDEKSSFENITNVSLYQETDVCASNSTKIKFHNISNIVKKGIYFFRKKNIKFFDKLLLKRAAALNPNYTDLLTPGSYGFYSYELFSDDDAALVDNIEDLLCFKECPLIDELHLPSDEEEYLSFDNMVNFDYDQPDVFRKLKTLYFNIYDEKILSLIFNNVTDWSNYYCTVKDIKGNVIYKDWFYKTRKGYVIPAKKLNVDIYDAKYTFSTSYPEK